MSKQPLSDPDSLASIDGINGTIVSALCWSGNLTSRAEIEAFINAGHALTDIAEIGPASERRILAWLGPRYVRKDTANKAKTKMHADRIRSAVRLLERAGYCVLEPSR